MTEFEIAQIAVRIYTSKSNIMKNNGTYRTYLNCVNMVEKAHKEKYNPGITINIDADDSPEEVSEKVKKSIEIDREIDTLETLPNGVIHSKYSYDEGYQKGYEEGFKECAKLNGKYVEDGEEYKKGFEDGQKSSVATIDENWASAIHKITNTGGVAQVKEKF